MKRGYIYASLALLLFGVFLLQRRRDKKADAQIAAPVLKTDERTKIVIDAARHSVTTVTRLPSGGEKTTRTFLNTHGPVAVVEKKDGSTVLVQRTWGTEAGPFVGFGIGSDIRMHAALGANIFYVQRWELGGGLLVNNEIRDTRLFVHVSYNAYANTFVSLGIDNRRTAQLLAGLHF